MRRKLARLVLGMVCSVSLAACGGGSGGGTVPVPSTGTPVTIDGYNAQFVEFAVPGGAIPEEITTARDGAAWFMTPVAVDRITSDGTIKPYVDPNFPANPSFLATTYGPAIARDLHGDLWFDGYDQEDLGAPGAFAGAKLGHLTTDGVFTGPFGNESNLFQAGHLTVGADGRAWFPACSLDFVVPCDLIATTPSGTQTPYIYGIPPGELFPVAGNGIVSAPNGSLYSTVVSNTMATRPYDSFITQSNVDGTFPKSFTLPNESFNVIPFRNPYAQLDSGITIGPDKNLWFVETASNKIGRMTLSGVLTEFAIPTANADAREITSASDGALWFTEHDANKVGRITTSGQIQEIAMPTKNSGPNGITACEPYGKCSAVPHARLWITEDIAKQVARLDY